MAFGYIGAEVVLHALENIKGNVDAQGDLFKGNSESEV